MAVSMPPASSIFAMCASISTFVMLIQTMFNQLVPRTVQHYFLNIFRLYFAPTSKNATIVIEERDQISSNEVFSAAELYLCTKVRSDIDQLKISKQAKETGLTIKFGRTEKIIDFFDGIELEWGFVNEERSKSSNEDSEAESEKRYFELRFEKRFRDRVLDFYVPFLLDRANSIRAEKKVVKLHTLGSGSGCGPMFVWNSINLEHPSTFDTLAMEPDLKKSIIDDLDRFVRRKDFYRKVGRAWKRGYLLYGPPGTGKSSLIAAMANYLKFDIFDLELTNIRRDSDLRKLLLRTANRSVLVIEDIDCTVELPNRNASLPRGQYGHPTDNQFTLSGLLNFIDGLWSSCGDERIIVFTTNNKEKLDPALLRPGRMDMHIHMSYLTPNAFHQLAHTYLNIHDDHPRLREIDDLIQGNDVTPAEIAEEFMKSVDVDLALDEVVNFLKNKEACKNKSVSDK